MGAFLAAKPGKSRLNLNNRLFRATPRQTDPGQTGQAKNSCRVHLTRSLHGSQSLAAFSKQTSKTKTKHTQKLIMREKLIILFPNLGVFL